MNGRGRRRAVRDVNDQGVVSVRFSPEQVDLIRRRADEHGRTPSAYIRDGALREELRSRPGTQVRRLPSGAELLFWTNSPLLTA